NCKGSPPKFEQVRGQLCGNPPASPSKCHQSAIPFIFLFLLPLQAHGFSYTSRSPPLCSGAASCASPIRPQNPIVPVLFRCTTKGLRTWTKKPVPRAFLSSKSFLGSRCGAY